MIIGNRKAVNHSSLIISLLVFFAIFLMSHVTYSLGFRTLLILPIAVIVLCYVMIAYKRSLPLWVLLSVLVALATSCISGLYWESWKSAFVVSQLAVSILMVSVATKKELNIAISVSSILLLFMLIGACIAFALSISGVEPYLTFYADIGRGAGIDFYYTSLAITYEDGYVRASGIYDEPGAFSLIVCVIAYLRKVLKKDDKLTWLMLMLGFITFSLAHLIYVIIHLLSEKKIFKSFASILLLCVVAVSILNGVGAWHYFEDRLFKRAQITSRSDRVLAGDNRSQFFSNAIDWVKNSSLEQLTFGVDVSCLEGRQSECSKVEPRARFNVLSPLILYGLLVSWPYYMFIICSIIPGMLKREYWSLVAVALLYMQRPSPFSAGYSMLLALVIILTVRSNLYKNMLNDFHETYNKYKQYKKLNSKK